ncbi:MAG: hypothetical protein ACI9JZ_002543 [Lentimonas sp.]|jgi:hypothetical protein
MWGALFFMRMKQQKPSQHFRLLNGVRVKRTVFYRHLWRSLVYFVGLAVLFGVSVVVWFGEESAEAVLNISERTKQVDVDLGPESADKREGEGLSPLVTVMQKHLEAMLMVDVESLAMTGTYHTGGVSFDLEVLAKKPGLFRQSLVYRDCEVVVGYDGREYWQESSAPEDAGSVSLIGDFNEQLLILESALAALGWEYDLVGLSGVKLLGDVVIHGRACHVLQNNRLISESVYHYIDVETGLELRRSATLSVDAELNEVIIDYVVSDFEVGGEGRRMPEGYALFLNGSLLARASFTAVRVNVGVMSWMFERPRGSELPLQD